MENTKPTEQQVTLDGFLDLLGQTALDFQQKLHVARKAAQQQAATIIALEAQVAALTPRAE